MTRQNPRIKREKNKQTKVVVVAEEEGEAVEEVVSEVAEAEVGEGASRRNT